MLHQRQSNMKRYLSIAAIVVLLAGGCSRVCTVERLHVEGTALMNESGDTVELKGMSFGWNVLWPRFYNRDAVRHVVHECR